MVHKTTSQFQILLTESVKEQSVFLHDGLFLWAGAEVSLDLSLIHSIQGQHEKNAPHSQSPECVPL